MTRVAQCLALRQRSRTLWEALGGGMEIEDALAIATAYVQLELMRYEVIAEYLHDRYKRTLKGVVAYDHHRF